MRTTILCLLSAVSLVACRSSDNPPVDFAYDDLHRPNDLAGHDLSGDMSANPDMDMAGAPDMNPDLTGADLSFTDMYKPPFASAVPYTTNNGPYVIANGLIDGDANLDLVVVTTDSAANTAALDTLLGTGDGTFSIGTMITQTIPSSSSSLSLGDVDGDTKIDAVIAAFDGNVYLLTGVGDGSFNPPTMIAVSGGSLISAARVADIDGDGNLDIVAADIGDQTTNGSVHVLLNDGTGAFPAGNQTTVSVSSNATDFRFPINLRVGQLDDDANGTLDIAVLNVTNASNNDGSFTVIQNNSTPGTVSLAFGTEVDVGASPTDLRIATIAGSNHPAVVECNQGDNNVSVFFSSTTTVGAVAYGATPTSFTAYANSGSTSGPTAVSYADVDGDGFSDILVLGGAGGGYLTIVYGGASGTFGTSTAHAGIEELQAGDGPTGMTTGLFDANASVDVAVASELNNAVNVLLNDR